MGYPVPAASYENKLIHTIYARLGNDDESSANHSTFAIEIQEAVTILKHCEKDSMALIDELGRGTSTVDGLALTTSIFEDLVGSKVNLRLVFFDFQAQVFFVSHFEKLLLYASTYPNVKLLTAERCGDRFTTASRMDPQSCYGFESARQSGLPQDLLDYAESFINSVNHPSHRASYFRKAQKTTPGSTSVSPTKLKRGAILSR